MFCVSSFRFRGKGPNVRAYQIFPSLFIKNEYIKWEDSPLNDFDNCTAGFGFGLFCLSFRPIISVFLRSPCNGDIALKDDSAK